MAAGFSLDISCDVSAARRALQETALNQKTIMRKVLRVIGGKAVKEIKKEIASSTKRRTGELRQAYTCRINKEGTSAVLYAKSGRQRKGKDKKTSIYPKLMALNYGAEITAKNARYLQVSGKDFYARKKSIKIAGRGFLQRAWSLYMGSGHYIQDVQRLVDNELAKFWR